MPDPKSPRKLIHLIFPPAHTDSANGQDSLEVRFKKKTNDARSQYRCGRVGRGIQPPPHTPTSHKHTYTKSVIADQRTDGRTNKASQRDKPHEPVSSKISQIPAGFFVCFFAMLLWLLLLSLMLPVATVFMSK